VYSFPCHREIYPGDKHNWSATPQVLRHVFSLILFAYLKRPFFRERAKNKKKT
jgi:hypothetical protein